MDDMIKFSFVLKICAEFTGKDETIAEPIIRYKYYMFSMCI